MADPFGIIGVVGLAGQVLASVVKLGLDLKDAPVDCQSFVRQLQALKTVLSETNTNLVLNSDFVEAFHGHHSTVLSQLQSTSQLTDTQRMVSACMDELGALIQSLRKRSDHKLNWERIKATFLTQKTRDAVGNLQRQCQILNSLVAIDAAALNARTYVELRHMRREQQETNAAVGQLHDRLDFKDSSKERDAILEWLSPINYASQHQDYIARRQPGTGLWLLESEEYREWSAEESSTLFCPGIPGAGKTILAATVIDHLLETHQGDPNIGVAFIYCNFQRQDTQKADDLLSSILKQLCEKLGFIPDALDILYSECKSKDKARPPSAKLLECLESAFSQFSRAFIVLDALDECQEFERRRFLTELSAAQKDSAVSILATSRFIPEISDHFSACPLLEIRARQSDVEIYLEQNMNKLKPFVQRNLKLQQDIKSSISIAVDGMFLLARTYLDLMGDMFTIKTIKKALANIQRQGHEASDEQKAKTLHAAYDDAMERINRQLSGSKDLALQVLAWLTFAKRPMTVLELRHALAVEVGEDEFDEENIPDLDDIVAICSGLVTIDEATSVIRLAHYTAQEYLQQTKDQWFTSAEAEIALTCVSYLNLEVFESGLAEDYDDRMTNYPLYEYAASNWGYHAQGTLDSYEEILDFLECSGKLEAAFQVISKTRQSAGFFYSSIVGVAGTSMHMLSYFGLVDAFDLQRTNDLLESGDIYDATPIQWAAANGQTEAVRRLIEKGVDPSHEDELGNTPFRVAAAAGHAEIVKMLLAIEEARPGQQNYSDSLYPSPITVAAENGQEEVVKILLKSGVDPETRDKRGYTPLMAAADNGHSGVVKMLLATRKVDVNAVIKAEHTGGGRTALWHATSEGHVEAAKVLLEHGATSEICFRTCNPRPPGIASGRFSHGSFVWTDGTVLYTAANYGFAPLVKYFVEKGLDVNHLTVEMTVKRERKHNRDEETGHVVQCLEDWIRIETRSPLSIAIERDHSAVVCVLKENGAADIHEVEDINLLPGSLKFGLEEVAYIELVEEKEVEKKICYHS